MWTTNVARNTLNLLFCIFIFFPFFVRAFFLSSHTRARFVNVLTISFLMRSCFCFSVCASSSSPPPPHLLCSFFGFSLSLLCPFLKFFTFSIRELHCPPITLHLTIYHITPNHHLFGKISPLSCELIFVFPRCCFVLSLNFIFWLRCMLKFNSIWSSKF